MSISVKWELSQRCNLNCKHCFVGKVNYEPELSLEDNKRIVDILVKSNVKNIMFSSKEPFMYDKFVELLKYCRLNGITISIITNGTLFNDAIVEELGKGIVKVISFSLEGITEYSNDFVRGKGVFKKVMSAANKLAGVSNKTKKTIPMALQISLTEINKKEVTNMHEFFENSPFISVNIGDITIVGNAKDNQMLKIPEQEYKSLIVKILEDYSKTENPKYSLHLKGLNIYETIYYNSIYDTSLDLILPSCSVYHGYYSILPDSTLCSCVALKGLESLEFVDIYSHNILVENKFDPSFKTDNKIKPIKKGFCKECRYTEDCELCLLIFDDENLTFDKECKIAHDRLKGIVEGILNGQIFFKFKRMTYIEKQNCNLIVTRYYYTNKRIETLIIGSESANYFEKVYRNNEWTLFDLVFDKDVSRNNIESLLFNDALYIKLG